MAQSISTFSLRHHLGPMPALPWSLGLRVEMDGALGEERYEAVMRGNGHGGAHVYCYPAFKPLLGKQFVAWRLMAGTLVFAVQTAGCSMAAAERGEEAGCSMAAAEGGEAGCSMGGAQREEDAGCNMAVLGPVVARTVIPAAAAAVLGTGAGTGAPLLTTTVDPRILSAPTSRILSAPPSPAPLPQDTGGETHTIITVRRDKVQGSVPVAGLMNE